jgi:pimeloyl-ACP methyl ester carboxylesterase
MISDRKLKVLCLHGHPGNSEAMQIFVQHFETRGTSTIAPDLRGYGNCKADSAFTMLDHIQDLENLLINDLTSDRDCEIDNTEYLILGWSLGGILAIELALRALDWQGESTQNSGQNSAIQPRLAGLILIATAAKPRSNLPKIAWWEYVNLAIAVALQLAIPKQRGIVEWFGKRSLIKYLIQQHTLTAYKQIATTGAKAYLQTSRYAQMALTQALKQRYDRTPDLAKIQIPCLAIAAAQDRHITAVSTAETAKLLPNCEFICYPDTAHLLPWEIGDRLLADIDAWTARLSKGNS